MAVSPSPESATEVPCHAKPKAPVPTSFACWLHRVRAREHPRGAGKIVVTNPTENGGISVTGKRYGIALPCQPYGARADQFRLLGPHVTGAREHPRGAGTRIVILPSDDRGVAVVGKRHGTALLCATYGARADQFRLLAELRQYRRRGQAPHQYEKRQSAKGAVPVSAS